MSEPTICPLDHPDTLARVLQALRDGQPVAFPTDTVYGVGVPAYHTTAVCTLYEVKQRPRTQALPVLLADTADLTAVARDVPTVAAALAEQHWPGALTLIVPAAEHLPADLIAHGDSVAVRVPDHPWLRALIRALGQPLATTSANRHGAGNTTTAAAVAEHIGTSVALIVDGGPTPGDVPSTLVDCTGTPPRVLRQGTITLPHLV